MTPLFVLKVCEFVCINILISIELELVCNNIIGYILCIGMPSVQEKILDYLDDKSLCKLHQVCKRWNEAINQSRAWDRKLQYKVC